MPCILSFLWLPECKFILCAGARHSPYLHVTVTRINMRDKPVRFACVHQLNPLASSSTRQGFRWKCCAYITMRKLGPLLHPGGATRGEWVGQPRARVRGESKERVGKEAPDSSRVSAGCSPSIGDHVRPPFWLHAELQEPPRGIGDRGPPLQAPESHRDTDTGRVSVSPRQLSHTSLEKPLRLPETQFL